MKNVITCKPLPADAKLPKVKPFHVTFDYHHSRFGDGIQMMNDGFSGLQFDLSLVEVLEADKDVSHSFKTRMIERLSVSMANHSQTIEKGLAIYRTALHNLNQWGSGESGHCISRNFEFLNPEDIDFY